MNSDDLPEYAGHPWDDLEAMLEAGEGNLEP